MTPSEPPNPAGPAFDQHGQTIHGPQTNIYNVYPEAVPFNPSSPGKRCDFYQHIPLPANYVPRPELLAEIKETLLQSQQDVALTSSVLQADALFGMGGIGKTVMARALCEDATVCAAFPDGILWATLGQTPDLPARLRDWARALGGTVPQTAPTLEELTNILAQSLAERHCLLIVDDVWEQAHLARFMVHLVGCRLLFTTRNAEIAHELNATIRPVPVMALREAIELLIEWAGAAAANIPPTQQVAIVERLGRLPLAIKLAGDQLRRRDPEKWLATFDARELRKRHISNIHDSLEKTFTLSLTDLTDIERQLYISLSIFKEDEDIVFPAVAKLWAELAGYNPDNTVDLLHFLNDRALLELSGVPGTQAGANRTEMLRATFHDLIRDLMRAELGPEGRHAGHIALLSAYRRSQKTGDWSSAPNDGYLYDHLVYHLSEVVPHNRIARQELLDLFANHKWLQVRVPAAGYRYDGYIADLEQAWHIYHQESHPEAKATGALISFPVHLRFALLRTSLNSLAANYGPALIGYAVEMDLWPTARAVSIFTQTPDPLHKVQIGCALLATGKLSTVDQSRVLQQSINFASAITPTEARLRVQIALYPFLPEAERDPMLHQLLAAIPTLPSEWLQVKALALLPLLAPVQHSTTLNLVTNLKNSSLQAEAVMAFMMIGNELSSTTKQTLAALIAKASVDSATILYRMSCQWPVVIDRSRAVLKSILENSTFSQVDNFLQKLTSLLSNEQKVPMFAQALAAALAIQDESQRAQVLTTLAPHLSSEQQTAALAQALTAALAIQGEWQRAQVLTTLAPHLSGEQQTAALAQALTTALAIQDESQRAQVLTTLAPHLSGEQILAQALTAVLAIQDESQRAQVLTTLAPHLRGEQQTAALAQALTAALAIQDESQRAQVLIRLAPHLSGEQILAQALTAALAIQDESQRIQALQKLMPTLSKPRREQAALHVLKEIPTFMDAHLRIDTLIWLIPYLPELRPSIYCGMIQDLQDEWLRTDLIELSLPYVSLTTRAAVVQLLPTFSDPLNRRSVAQLLSAQSTGATIEQPLQASTIEQAIQTSIAIEDKPNRVKIYVTLAKQLRTETKGFVSDRLNQELDGLDPSTELTATQLRLAYCQEPEQRAQLRAQAIGFSLKISNRAERTKALLDLLLYLEPDEQLPVVGQLVNTVRAIQEIKELAQIILQIMENVHFTAKQEVAGIIFAYVMATKEMTNTDPDYTLSIDNVGVELLCMALPFLGPIFQQCAIRQVLHDVQYLDGAEARARALTALLPYLRGIEHIAIFHRILSTAHAIDDELMRFAILVKAASVDINRRAFSEAKTIATALEDPKARAEAIVSLLPLAEPLEKHLLLRKGLKATFQITKQSERAATLANYIPYVKNAQPIVEELCFAVIHNLRVQARISKRADLLDYLANEPIFQSAQLPEELVLTIATTISEICNDWVWL